MIPSIPSGELNEFSWTMVKLNSLDWSSKRLTNFAKFLKKVTLTDNGEYEQQVVTRQNYQLCFKTLSSDYKKFIFKINETVKGIFSELENIPIFTNVPI